MRGNAGLHKLFLLVLVIANGPMAAVVIKNGDSFLMGIGQKRLVCIEDRCKDIPFVFGQQFSELFQWLNSSSKVTSSDIRAVIREVAEAKKIVDIQLAERNRRSLSVIFVSSDSLFRPTIRIYKIVGQKKGALKIETNSELLVICDSCTVVQRVLLRKLFNSVKDSTNPDSCFHPQ